MSAEATCAPASLEDRLARAVFEALEAEFPRHFRGIRDLSNVAPGLLVVRDDEFVHPFGDDITLRSVG